MLPPPVSYTRHLRTIWDAALCQVEKSLNRARKEVREHYNAKSPDEVIDIFGELWWKLAKKRFYIIVWGSFCDLPWNRKGYWLRGNQNSVKGVASIGRKKDKESPEYKNWKENHSSQCDMNFSGSAGAMEPEGMLSMFQHSLNYKLRYKYLIADGDSKTHSLLLGKTALWQGLKKGIVLDTFKSEWELLCISWKSNMEVENWLMERQLEAEAVD